MNELNHADGGELLVQVLREAGVDTVFGIVSVHNLPLVEAVSRELRFVPVRHEAAAVNAADGYARATGGLGCALTSTGTGAGNAAGSLIESLSSGTSVLHVTGQVELEFLGSGRAGGPRGAPRAGHAGRAPADLGRWWRDPLRSRAHPAARHLGSRAAHLQLRPRRRAGGPCPGRGQLRRDPRRPAAARRGGP